MISCEHPFQDIHVHSKNPHITQVWTDDRVCRRYSSRLGNMCGSSKLQSPIDLPKEGVAIYPPDRPPMLPFRERLVHSWLAPEFVLSSEAKKKVRADFGFQALPVNPLVDKPTILKMKKEEYYLVRIELKFPAEHVVAGERAKVIVLCDLSRRWISIFTAGGGPQFFRFFRQKVQRGSLHAKTGDTSTLKTLKSFQNITQTNNEHVDAVRVDEFPEFSYDHWSTTLLLPIQTRREFSCSFTFLTGRAATHPRTPLSRLLRTLLPAGGGGCDHLGLPATVGNSKKGFRSVVAVGDVDRNRPAVLARGLGRTGIYVGPVSTKSYSQGTLWKNQGEKIIIVVWEGREQGGAGWDEWEVGRVGGRGCGPDNMIGTGSGERAGRGDSWTGWSWRT